MSNINRLEGILKWSLSQTDGTKPSRQITEEERKWFQEAISANMVDVVQRMKEIALVMGLSEEALLKQGVTVDELASLLEELQEHVESIDMANDVKAVGGLEPLLAFLKSPHPQLRSRAAEVVMTMVQNNEKSQRQVMAAGGHLTLFHMFLSDPDTAVRAKVTGAISSLVQHNQEGIDSFRSVVGVVGIIQALSTTDVRLQRKILVLATLFLQQSAADRTAAVQGGIVAALTSSAILCSESADVRSADRQLLQELTPAILATHTPPSTMDMPAASATRPGDATGAGVEGTSRSSQSVRTQILEALKLRIDALSKDQHSGVEDDGHDELAGLTKLRRQILEGKGGSVEASSADEGLGGTSTSIQNGAPVSLLLGGPPSAN